MGTLLKTSRGQLACQYLYWAGHLLLGGGGATKLEGGGHMMFYPNENGGWAEKVLAMLEGGHKKFWGSFYMVARSFSHIEWGGVQKVSTL